MKTLPCSQWRFVSLLLAAFASVSFWVEAASATGVLLPPPLISLRASVPETREPFCDPAICDAAPPPPGVFVLSRKGGDLARELSVMILVSGSASNGVDFARLPGFVQFRAGSETAELYVEAAYDLKAEGDESVVVQVLPDPTMGPIERYRVDPAQSVARVIIYDNETPGVSVVGIEAISPIAEETSFPYRRLAFRGRFAIARTGPVDDSLTCFVTYGGSATPDVDYPALPWVVTIPAGTNRVEIEVEPKHDEVAEPIEFIDAQLSECPPFPLLMPCRLLNIDPAHAMARVFIRDDGITTASVAITAPRSGEEFKAGAPIPITATAIDLEGAMTHIEFFDDGRKIGESTIFFIREPDPGTPIYHEFVWTGAAAGLHTLTAVGIEATGAKVQSLPVSITVGGGLPVVSIEATYAETSEPSPLIRVRPGLFSLRRTGDASAPLRVWMRYSGTATSGADYAALPAIVEFPAGALSVELQVVAMQDERVEGDETVIAALTLSPLAVIPNYQIDPTHAEARIVIHDQPPAPVPNVVSIVAIDPFAREGTSSAGLVDTATFVVTRTGNANSPLLVRYALSGTASNLVDYETLSGSLTIPAGERRARLVIKPVDDRRVEPVETVVARLVSDDALLAGYEVGFPGRAAAIIVDNDRLRPPCLRLPDGLFNFCLPVLSGDCFRVEVTGDFKEWTAVCVVPVDSGVAHFVDPDAPRFGRRFYRFVPVPCDP